MLAANVIHDNLQFMICASRWASKTFFTLCTSCAVRIIFLLPAEIGQTFQLLKYPLKCLNIGHTHWLLRKYFHAECTYRTHLILLYTPNLKMILLTVPDWMKNISWNDALEVRLQLFLVSGKKSLKIENINYNSFSPFRIQIFFIYIYIFCKTIYKLIFHFHFRCATYSLQQHVHRFTIPSQLSCVRSKLMHAIIIQH